VHVRRYTVFKYQKRGLTNQVVVHAYSFQISPLPFDKANLYLGVVSGNPIIRIKGEGKNKQVQNGLFLFFFDGYDSKLYPGLYHVVAVLTSDSCMSPYEPFPNEGLLVSEASSKSTC
jgi:hypothetical protein